MKEIDKRRQRKMDKALEERDLLRLWRKQLNLWKADRVCNIVQLEKPIRRGWIRFFVLRPDISRSPDGKVIKPLLPLVNSIVQSRDGSFMYKPWNSKVKKPIQQGISYVRHEQWNKVEKTLTIKQKSMFDKIYHQHYHKGRPTGGHWGWHFHKPWMFVHKVEPYYVTHRVVINPQLESETKELWNRIYASGKIHKITKILGEGYGYRDDYDWGNMRIRLIKKALEKDQRQSLVDYEERYMDEDYDFDIEY